ncbi:MAG: PLP-dependent aspartate aminotransferase family protein, partial [Anaerolineae bacterium]|nr:PLP-dependent aspartate aminotransferase family protein [Anaerolineae bacterium]
MDLRRCGMHTRAVHAGERAGQREYTPVSTAIERSVGYLYERMEDLDAIFANARPGYVYPRYGNPTVSALEQAVATLEGGEAAVATASGMAAVHLVLLAATRPGESVVAARDLYGATYALLSSVLRDLGVRVTFVDAADLPATEAAVEAERPRLLLVETISNPLLKLADVPALADLAHRAGALLAVDSTFTSPYLLQPLAWGADYVLHSATKYLGGHGDVLGGVVVASGERIQELRELLKLTGGNLGPDAAWLVLRGLKTLPLRMRQQCENAMQVARWLAGQPDVAAVHYPGLPQHPQHALAGRLLRQGLYGGMVSFELAGAKAPKVYRFMEALRLCLPATTLGDVYTLVLYPAMSSHRAVPADERERLGIGEGLVRISVGIEDVAD